MLTFDAPWLSISTHSSKERFVYTRMATRPGGAASPGGAERAAAPLEQARLARAERAAG